MYLGEGGNRTENQSQERQEKVRAWLEKVSEVEKRRDALGEPVDKRILDTVVGLNMLEIPTRASCEGHIDHGRAAPWIDIEASNRPQERFIDEEKIVEAVAQKYHISVEDVRRNRHHEAYLEATNAAGDNGETRDFLIWQEANRALQVRVAGLLDEFYRNRSVDEPIRLMLASAVEGFRMHNGGNDYSQKPKRSLSKEERRALNGRLVQYQNEMSAFTEFLREKYFDSE